MAQARDETTDTLQRQTRTQHSPSSSLTTAPTLRKQLSAGRLPPATTSSAGASPRTSRNTSPLRKDSKGNTLSSQPAAQPSTAAAIQRALSASNIPQIVNAARDGTTRLPRAAQLGAEEAPHWPVSPRLKSPPPSGTRRTPSSATVIRKAEDGLPTVQTISTQTAPPPQVQSPRQLSADSSRSDSLQTPAKNASRGPSGKSVLATVDEHSSDAIEPSPAARQAAADLKPLTRLSDDDKPTADADKASKAGESGSESGGNKSEGRKSRRPSVSQPNQPRTKGNYPKVRQLEASGNMTVETETVQSIPHSGLGSERTSSTRGDGTLKVKSSTETIRPRKERRPASRKPRSVTGNASTKADIFEARVASAVGEANSSDSDETFVYESNPPEPRTHRRRHHSRTPSVTSAHSTADQRSTVRNIGEALSNDERRVAGKRSMKFSNNPFNSSDSPTDRQDGTVRSHHQPRHYGRWGRGGSHASMFEQPDSPFTAASKLRSNPHSLRHSRPHSPNSPQNSTSRGAAPPPIFGRKQHSPFDFDAEGDIDERTPLMRTPRSRHASRMLGINDEEDELDEYYHERRGGRCGSLSGCLLGVLIFILVASSTIGFLVMSNRPLAEVRIRRIENVLASEEELMLDLSVAALNPNALSVSIAELDVNIFAKSKYLTSPREPGKKTLTTSMRRRPYDAMRDGDLEDLLPGHGDDDLPEDSDAALWLLGQALKFDQPLVFDGTPFESKIGSSVGALRLAHPGNRTETGSAGWEKIVHHPFELLIRGVLKYNLPVSARLEAVTVAASVLVHPEDGLDDAGRMRVEPIDHSDHWQWIDWEREHGN